MALSLRARWRSLVENNDRLVQQRAQLILNDRRLDRWRTPWARRALVAVTGVLIVTLPVAFALAGSVVGLAVVVLTAGAWYVLMQSVRTIPDLPDEHLDERLVRLRDRAYVEAYRWLSVLTVLLASAGLVTFMALGRDPGTDVVSLSWDLALGMFWFATAAVLALPSVVLALRESEPPAQ